MTCSGSITATCSSEDDDDDDDYNYSYNFKDCPSEKKFTSCASSAYKNPGNKEECDMCVCNNMQTLSSGSGDCDASPEDWFECLVTYNKNDGDYTCSIGVSQGFIAVVSTVGVVILIACITGCVCCCCRNRSIRRAEPPNPAGMAMPNPLVQHGVVVGVATEVQDQEFPPAPVKVQGTLVEP